MNAMIQVGTKFTQQTLDRVEQFARENGIVHSSSGKVNSAEAVRRLVEMALERENGQCAGEEQEQ